MSRCAGPVNWAGSCYLVRGISSEMYVQSISNMGCGDEHVESVYVSKYQPPGTIGNHALTDYVEIGWQVDRKGTFCQSSPARAFVAWEVGGTGVRRSFLGNLSTGSSYVFKVWQPWKDGRFQFQVEDTSGNLVTAWDALESFSWVHGSGIISQENTKCSIEIGLKHHNTWTQDKGGTGQWLAANTYRGQPLQLHTPDPGGGLFNSCPSPTGGWKGDWTSGSGNTGDHIAYSNT